MSISPIPGEINFDYLVKAVPAGFSIVITDFPLPSITAWQGALSPHRYPAPYHSFVR